MNDKEFIKIVKALSDENRLKLLKETARRGTLCCAEAQKITELSQPTISHHLSLLIDAELVASEKDGRVINLSLNEETLKKFIAALKELL